MTEIEKLIHSADGTLKPDLPWYCIEGTRGQIIDYRNLEHSGVSLEGIYKGEVLITRDAARENIARLNRTRRKSLPLSEIWFTMPEFREPDFVWIGKLSCIKKVND